ncbi:MAG TPA: glycosyltransferase family 4 protein [Vicinamibacterales bacterium]|nr:glycosyltransferase family 4 protein [Vicinamibacterales bacterium]
MAVITIVTSAPPLTEGGHLVLARSLERALTEAGHRAGIVTTPSNRFGRQGPAYLANWLTDVGMTGGGEKVDQIITLRFPAYAVRHPRHVCWLVHTMREYYDLWDEFSSRLSPQGRLKERTRRALIRAADSYFFKHHVSKLFTISGAVRDRLAKWNGVAGEVLHPPPPQRDYRCDGYGDYLFFASRLSPLKRGDLILQALARPDAGGVKCVIGGEGEDRLRLERLAKELRLDGRVTFTGQLSEAELVGHLARCRAVVFVPRNEDYGFVTVEAFASTKPVITTTDSGGPLEFVRSGENGLVTSPEPEALARAFAEVSASASLAERLGARAKKDVGGMSWADAVRKLVIV